MVAPQKVGGGLFALQQLQYIQTQRATINQITINDHLIGLPAGNILQHCLQRRDITVYIR